MGGVRRGSVFNLDVHETAPGAVAPGAVSFALILTQWAANGHGARAMPRGRCIRGIGRAGFGRDRRCGFVTT